MAFTPFMQGSKAQGIINDYLGGKLTATPNVNSAGMWRNPNFDLRTEQEKAGTLDKTALYPNPQIDFSAQDDPVDPCREGFMLVDGICQPIETFGQSAYDEQRNDDPNDPPREYYSIDEMKEMGDYDFLKYLTGAGAYMTGKDGQYTLKNPFSFGSFGAGLNILGLDSSGIRNEFMKKKLKELGYTFTNNEKGEPVYNLTTPMGIINNAQAANQIMTGNQQFTDPEISYQVQAKMDKERNENQNPGSSYQIPQMTQEQVIADAISSGASSFNPHEAFGLNQSTPANYTEEETQAGTGSWNFGNPNLTNR